MDYTSQSTQEDKISIKTVLETFKMWPRMYKILFQANKFYFLGIVSLSIITGLIPAVLILLLELLVNQVSVLENFNLVLVLFGLYLGLIIVSSILDTVVSTLKQIYQDQITKEIDIRIMDKASSLPYEYFENHIIYDNIKRARDESTYRPYQIFEQSIGIISGVVTLVSVSAILILWKWWLILLLLVIPVISAVSFLKLGQQEYQLSFFHAPKRRILYYITHLMTTDSNVKEIQTFNKSKVIKNKYVETYERIFEDNKRMSFKRLMTTLLFDCLTLLIVGFVLLQVIRDAFSGLIAIGSLIAYIQAVNRTQSQSSSVLHLCFNLYQNNLFLNQLFSFLDLPTQFTSQRKNHQSSWQKDGYQEQLVFENVTFAYPTRNNMTLRDIDFSIKPGEVVALVGENGSGKSTLTKLLCRLFNPTSGNIFYKGIPIQDFEVTEWQSKLSVVFQEFNRYEFSAFENITLGSNEYDEKQVIQAADLSGAKKFIDELPDKFNSQLGVWFDGGVQLSGGQWQKLAIARAFVREAEIYILDEPTSAIDAISQEEIFLNFKEICRDKIGIFISHRLSNIIHADKIIVLKEGEICEIGTHYELMENKGHYYRLYDSQSRGYAKEKESALSYSSS
jgi:ATP-binding cassette, subfamily B, bacterial NisT/SpaT